MQTPRAEPDMQQILFEAKNRWLRPGEICEILHNYHNFNITPDPPYLPSGGSLYLFDRKALRYFRKDGHHWRKKKDGKTVREAHEKLKAGSVDVLHCYYAHGEDNENFQRRCYWLLDGKYEHIVLVHYRDLSEDTSSNVPQLLGSDLTFQSAQTIPIAGSAPINSFALAKPASQSSSTSNLDWNIQPASSEFEVADSGDFLSEIPLAVSVPGSGFQVESLTRNSITVPITVRGSIFHPYTTSSMNCVSLSGPVNPSFLNQVTSQNLILNSGQNVLETSPSAGSFGFQFNNDNSASALSEFYDSEQNLTDTEEHKLLFQPQCCVDAVDSRTRDSVAQNDDRIMSGLHDGFHVLPEPYSQPITVDDIIQVEEGNVEVAVPPVDEDSVNNDCIQIDNMPHEHKLDLAPQSDFNEHAEVVPSVSSLGTYLYDDDPVDLDKFDSIERWMNKELGSDCYNSLIASDSCTYWNAINSQHDKVFSSMSRHIQLDVDLVAPSLSQVQLFSIDDFSPNWAYAGAETKVLISGAFLGGIQPSNIKWCCMFGEVEVLAEVLMTNAIRCLAPPHSPGRVPFYITCSNRLACSEVREFEYRENPPNMQQMLIDDEPVSEDEIFLQIQFAKMLSIGSDEKRLLCSIKNCAKCIITKVLAQMLIDDEPGWEKIEKETKACQGYLRNLRNGLLEKLLKGKLYEWLVCKLHEDDKGPNILDDKGQGAIHLAAALGYEWAMAPIFAAGVNPNFRDLHGRTALHWAAHYGREQTIVTLLKLGASPGAIEDPTSKFPVGQTAADLASSRGHKGIAAYLAEADLTSHLNSMSIAENVMGSVSASLAAEEAVENVEEENIFSSVVETGQISLRESLAAVRNSAQAAARIYAAFRAQSFRHRQLTRNTEHADNACEVLLHSSPNNNVHKIGRFNEYLHASAIKIQQKYRGWKRRKEFLKIRNRIVKIQAHVRGHQVRKQYKQFVWSVGIVEKAILRWRRKRSGLRGFRAENAIRGGADPAVDKVDEYDFLHVGRKQKAACLEKALQRVKSMVLYPEAREQYRRLLASSRDSKAGSV
ncbi:calmodulin-binding transcription activator 1-like isoform X2 [Phalaenopsis equestris]|uniref:calmodulin-binding transcription activator 1-like isoform X2 n=1 Tax=Phalaenopsis equestris TaxID=78828 RepID=UPI0009E450AC|nr:calmodulin-binding transcription activator 1-like isoform X2 [Phalaenopsis equestris]